MNKSQASWLRKILGSFLIGIFASFHFGFLFQNDSVTWVSFLAVFALMIYKSNKQKSKSEVKHSQYKILSILSFLLPISAAIYSLVFTANEVSKAGSETAEAGAAIGGSIGGMMIVTLTFFIGISLGIVFYLLSRKKNK